MSLHALHDFELALIMPELAGRAQEKKSSKRTMKKLAFLASIFLRDPWWKDYEFASEDERYTLCGRDCCGTLEIADKLEGLLI